MKALITGINGFAGFYLKEILQEKGYEVFGIDIKKDKDEKYIYKGDLNNREFTLSVLDSVKPDIIYHLAATTSVRRSWEIPFQTIQNNYIVSLTLMEWAKNNKKKLFIMGSGEIYGNKKNFPIKESSSVNPLTPYSLSKYMGEKSAIFLAKNFGTKIFLSRAFNFTGPGQREVFVIPAFSKQLAEMEACKREKTLKVGNLSAIRDFSDVRDTVKAIYLITHKGKPATPYNIASGKSYSIKEILNKLLKMVDFKVKIIENREEFRKNDIKKLEGSSELLKNHTGWKPMYNLEKTLEDTLNYWRKKVSEG